MRKLLGDRILVGLIVLVAAGAIADMFVGSGFSFLAVMLLVAYGIVRASAPRLSRFVARLPLSLRVKIISAVSLMALLFVAVSFVSIEAMNYMHAELHEIEKIDPANASAIVQAVYALEQTQHGFFFSVLPLLSLVGALVAFVIGAAIALSVIDPLARMAQAMRRIAAGDFSEPVLVENRDELGELAERINRTSEELASLQAATLADERARALRERISQVSSAQEEERRRLSRELHDGLGPSLAALVNRLRACRQYVAAEPWRAQAELDDVAQTLKGHIQEIRHLINDLRPLAVDQVGLVAAIRQELERFSLETGVQAFSMMAPELTPDPLKEVTLFRVVQECLSNIKKHAAASSVEVVLHEVDGGFELTVRDDGCGFDARRPAANGSGVGLHSMKERAELIGGRLSLQSTPGHGSLVRLFVPALAAQKMEEAVGANSSPAR